MTFKGFQKKFEDNFRTSKLSDIAVELKVSPQVVSNWKARNQVPYKYVKSLRKKVMENKSDGFGNSTADIFDSKSPNILIAKSSVETSNENISLEDLIFSFYFKIRSSLKSFLFPPIFLFFISIIYLIYFAVPVYTAKAKILPIMSKTNASSAQGLAAKMGINIGSSDESNGLSSSAMVPEIIKSRRLARYLLTEKFSTSAYGEKKKLINILLEDTLTSEFSDTEKSIAISILSEMIELDGGGKFIPLITLSINTNEAKFSAALADTVIGKLNQIITKFKLSQVKEKKIFIKTRLKEIEARLRLAEERLRDFRDKNRAIYSSPALMLDQARITRDVEVQSQIQITLMTQYEMTKIEEVQKSDMLQVLDQPEVPIGKTSPKSNRVIGACTFAGFFISLLFIFGKDWVIRNKSQIIYAKNNKV